MPEDLAEQVAGIGVLAEPVRRELYLYVAAQPDAVGREQAAAALDVPVHTAKFHLDRLVAEDLLEVEYRRLTGRTGPGAGRPAKLYRRSARELSVSLPERRYDLAGEVLAEAIDRAVRQDSPVDEAVREVATERGRLLALEHSAENGNSRAPGSASDGVTRTGEVLARHGYEPRPVEDELCLANCPFDRLAAEHTELVCGMNLALVSGVIDGLEVRDAEARLAPAPGLCCVKVSPARRG